MKSASAPLYHSLRFQITAAILLLLAVLFINTSFSFYSENERRTDYQVLRASGNIQQLFQSLISRSNQYAEVAPRDWETYFRDIGIYGRGLKHTIGALDENIASLTTFPQQQAQWQAFSAEIKEVMGDPKEPKLEAVSLWIQAHTPQLQQLAKSIADQTHMMLDSQLSEQRKINSVLLVLSGIIGLATLIVLYTLFSKPLGNILLRLQNLARGEIQSEQTITSRNEMGTIYRAIDDLAINLKTTFSLTQSINQSTNIDDALCFVYEEYKQLLPVDALCLIHDGGKTQSMTLDRVHSDQQIDLQENRQFSKDHCELGVLKEIPEPLLWQQRSEFENKHSELVNYLHQCGIQSALFIPFNNHTGSILLFASRHENAFDIEHLQLLKNAGGQLQHAFEKTELVETLVVSAISGLSKLAESRDPETGDHLDRMSQYSMIVAEELSVEGPYQERIDNRYIRDILRFSPMHDIGKVGIADNILLKPGRLTDDERHDMEFHPAIGGEVLRRCEEQLNASGHSMFTLGIEIAEGHHEKWNGKGYPHGWKGEETPLSARIVAVADVFDALTSKRPYKDAWPVEKALGLLQEEAGEHFDPAVVDAFMRAQPRVMAVYERLKHV